MTMIKKKLTTATLTILYLASFLIFSVKAPVSDEFDISEEWTVGAEWTGEESDNSPTYSNLGSNTSLASNNSKIYCYWEDDNGLSHAKLEHNNTGSLQNVTSTLSGVASWQNVTLTLNSTVGVVVAFRRHANDSVGQWNSTAWSYICTTYEWSHTEGTSSFWGNFMCLIRCMLDRKPAHNVLIEFYLLPYNERIGGVTTDFTGRADYNLPLGEYYYTAKGENSFAEGYILHSSYQELTIELLKEDRAKLTLDVKGLLVIAVFFSVIALAIYAILSIKKF